VAIVAAPSGAVVAETPPSTRMPWARRDEAKDAAAPAAGVRERGRKLTGLSASSGLPDAVSRPWSTSSEVMGVTLPVVT